MTQVNVAQAKARLSELIEAALRGERVVIARRNKPLVQLVALEESRVRPLFGKLRGKIELSSDFDEPLEAFDEYMR